MDKPAKPKDTFYLFRRERTSGEGYEYIQHLISPSHDDGLSTSCYPEYAWRGQTLLDIKKMKYLISIHRYYKDSDWELVKYEMEIDTPSWSHQPERKEYDNLKITNNLHYKDMIAKDKHYCYKGNEYVVVGFTKMKSTLDGTWVEAVQYKRATEVDDPNVEPFTREKSDFEYKFIPAVLEVDMEIVAVSMGKLVAEYKVTEVGEDNATAISPSDVELVVSKNVSPNGEVTKVSGGVGYTAEYYVMMPDMKKRVSNRTIITAMSSALSDAAVRVQQISASSETYDLQSAQASIDQTLQMIYTKFGV